MPTIAPRSTIKATILHTLECNELLNAAVAAITQPVIHNGYNRGFGPLDPLDANTTIPASQCAYFRLDLEGDYELLDLMLLPGLAGWVSGEGEKLRAILFSAPSTNNGPITIENAIVNGYPMCGTAFSMEIRKNQVFGPFYFADEGRLIDDTHRYIAIGRLGTGSGTGTGTGSAHEVKEGYLNVAVVTG